MLAHEQEAAWNAWTYVDHDIGQRYLCTVHTRYTLHTQSSAADEKLAAAGAAASHPPGVYYMKQTIGNACGTIAMLHAFGNNAGTVKLGAYVIEPLSVCCVCVFLPERGMVAMLHAFGNNAGTVKLGAYVISPVCWLCLSLLDQKKARSRCCTQVFLVKGSHQRVAGNRSCSHWLDNAHR